MSPSIFQKLRDTLFQPIDASSLGLFRCFYGAVLFLHTYWQYEVIAYKYLVPKFFFSYPNLAFIKPPPGDGIYILFWIMLISAIAIIFGVFYRFAAVAFFISYLYVFLIDITYYKNHFYLLGLLSFLMIFANADAKYAWKLKRAPASIYCWQLLIIKLQFCAVYFYAAIAKMSPDWLQGEPMRTFLPRIFSGDSWLHQFLRTEAAAYLLSYSGLLIDLCVPFLLFHKKTRMPAAIVALCFHLLNRRLFPTIGVFPFLMMASLILFFDPDWPERLLKKIKSFYPTQPYPQSTSGNKPVVNLASSQQRQNLVTWCFIIYFFIQLVLPLRHHLFAGDVLWTSQGERFSWRMILKIEKGRVTFWIYDPDTNAAEEYTDYKKVLNARQFITMMGRPEMILQFAHYLYNQAREKGIQNPQIYVDARHSINGRPYQQKITPDIDLSKIKPTDNYMHWMLPFDKSIKINSGYAHR